MSHLPTLPCVALVRLLPMFLIGGFDAVFGARGAVWRLIGELDALEAQRVTRGSCQSEGVLHPGRILGLKRLHQHQNLERIDWKCLRYDVPHRTQIARLFDVIFQVFGHRDDGAKALGLKNLHCSRMRVVGYKSLVLVSTISTVLMCSSRDAQRSRGARRSRHTRRSSRCMTSFSRTGWLTRWV